MATRWGREELTFVLWVQSYEKSLVQALYAHIRAGRMHDAVELCRKAHQPWRAASIRGSLLFQWHAIGQSCLCISTMTPLSDVPVREATEPRDEDVMDEEDFESWKGNQRRRLWKTACTRAALNVRTTAWHIDH